MAVLKYKDENNEIKIINSIKINNNVESWNPNPTWWDIDSILENDIENYPGKVIILKSNDSSSNIPNYFNRAAAKVKTSDGVEYKNSYGTINHIWDETKDKPCNLGYKTRYVIYYFNETKINFNVNAADNSMLYFISKGITFNSANNNYYFKRVECMKFLDGSFEPTALHFDGFIRLKKIVGLSLEKVTSLTSFASTYGLCNYQSFFNDYPEWNTSNITSFYNAFNNSGLTYIKSLDFNKVTNIANMFNTSTIYEIGEIKNIKISGINLGTSGNFNKTTLIRFLNALYDYSDDIETTHNITFGAGNLARLTEEEIAIGTNKGWTIS